MIVNPRLKTEPLPVAEAPSPSRFGTFLGAAIVALFAACFFQFAFLNELAPPASERVNDGAEATFFAVHINPYYVFSEDFHLYVVRAKRILDRGWTDSPLAHHPNEGKNFAAPLQVGLSAIALQTEGRPGPYAAFMVAVIATAWVGLFLAARRWLPTSVRTSSILIAVLVTVLFESVGGIAQAKLDYVQWPVHRGLRLSTLGWTSPVVLSLVIAASSLLFDRARLRGQAAAILALLLVLAAADNWAFVTAFAAVGIVAAALAFMTIAGRIKTRPTDREFAAIFVIGVPLLASLALHLALGGALQGDALARGGMGPQWRGLPDDPAIWYTLRRYAVFVPLLFVLPLARIRLAGARRPPQAWARLWLGPPESTTAAIVAVAIVPMTAVLIAVWPLYLVVGMESYHTFQFIWRVEFCLLMGLALLAAELGGNALRTWSVSRWPARRLELVAAVALVAGLFVYHNYRVFRFVSTTAAREFFLTADAEALGKWLRGLPSEDVRSLATASHELNFLCAYWTNAELLLPEGFPYHNAASNEVIERQTADLLRVYRTPPESWTKFNLHGHSDDQWSWHDSRLRSAREGYSYYLMHRAMSADGYDNPYEWAAERIPARRGTTGHVAEGRARERRGKEIAASIRYHRPIAAIEMVDRVAEMLAEETAPPRPDVIVIDEVSRALGKPDLAGYRKAFAHGSIEAWRRIDSNLADLGLSADGADVRR